jgi:hypothetical protein
MKGVLRSSPGVGSENPVGDSGFLFVPNGPGSPPRWLESYESGSHVGASFMVCARR